MLKFIHFDYLCIIYNSTGIKTLIRMKKLYKGLIALVVIIMSAPLIYARQISSNEAMTIASNFLMPKSTSISTQSTNRLNLAYTAKSIVDVNKNNFFVFNKGVQEGFIIVAADDCAQTSVLGYSDIGEFDNDNLPANFQWWIEQYQREIDYAIKYNLSATSTIQTFATSVAPLLGNIAWNQGDPYNLLCPALTNSNGETERTVTGCVATATAQVMCYHKWPAKGTGSYSYTWNNGGKTLSMDFSKSTYDWDNMTETYSSASTTTQKNAVAKLMYDCGISCGMNYGLSETGGSSASSFNQVAGLYNYFGYDQGMEHLTRDYYKLADWNNLIINEINNKRPILYHGQGSGGGHAFIIDGYNKEGYFHFNWGWGGSSDGYFVTTALNPGELGIGGGAGGYNYNQGMTIGVQPAQESSTPSYEITSDGISISEDATNGFVISATRILNYNWNAATFSTAFQFESLSNGTIQRLQFLSNRTLNSLYYYNPISYAANSLASYLNDDEYKVSLVVKPSTSSTWEAMPTLLGAAEYVYMTVSGGKATNVKYDPTSVPDLLATGFELNDKLYVNRVATLKAKVKNNGAEYLGDMILVFADNTGKILATSGLVMTNIQAGETKDIPFEYTMISLADGISITTETPCYVYLFGDASENSAFQIGQLGTATLYPVGSGSPALAFTKAPKVNSSTEDNLSFTLNLINNGAIFKDAITFHTWDADNGNTYCGGISQFAMLENNESKELTFSFPYDGVVGHTYLVNIYANNAIIKGNTSSINYVCSFVLGESTGVDNVIAKYEMTINNSNNILNISTEQPINNIFVYNTNGALVANEKYSGESKEETISLEFQPIGVYLIKVETTDDVKISKIYIK